MNHMKDIAQMLGVEMEEQFEIKGDYFCGKYKFTNEHLQAYDTKLKCWKEPCDTTLRRLIIGELEIINLPKPILDDVEKEYLSNVIKPFRKRIIYIMKRQLFEHDYIDIRYKHRYGGMSMIFPEFKIGAMYKGMKLNKKYSLDDLGL